MIPIKFKGNEKETVHELYHSLLDVSNQQDKKEYIFQFSYEDDYGEGETKVYIKLNNVEELGWRVEGLPIAR